MNSPNEARSCQLPEPGGLPLPLLEEENSVGEEGEKEKPGGGGVVTWYGGNLRFPSESYFLGLPLFFFPNKSKLPLLVTCGPPLPGVVAAAVVVMVVVVFVVVIAAPPKVLSMLIMLFIICGGITALTGGGESVSTELPDEKDTVLSFSSIVEEERDRERACVCVCLSREKR